MRGSAASRQRCLGSGGEHGGGKCGGGECSCCELGGGKLGGGERGGGFKLRRLFAAVALRGGGFTRRRRARQRGGSKYE